MHNPTNPQPAQNRPRQRRRCRRSAAIKTVATIVLIVVFGAASTVSAHDQDHTPTAEPAVSTSTTDSTSKPAVSTTAADSPTAEPATGEVDASSVTVDEWEQVTARAEALIAELTELLDAPTPGTSSEDPTTPASAGDAQPMTAAGGASAEPAYQDNLDLVLSATVRNQNHDDSPWLDTPSDQLVAENHYGPRSDYLGNPGGNPARSFPVAAGGQFRAECEFSHFAYDDPLVYPNQPGAAHLHLFVGNTHVNAHTTYDHLINTGSSTCNGQELNRTGYWVPALFDDNGNVRIPERAVVYYKGEGRSRGESVVYPDGAAMIATTNLNTASSSEGGVDGQKLSFVCSDQYSTNTGQGAQTMPDCQGPAVLEVNVKFPQCWNGQDPDDIDSYHPPAGNWYGSNCAAVGAQNLPNLEYFVNYPVEEGETTANWFLSSDVDPATGTKTTGGSTLHADWWGGWHQATNQMWIDNCVNYITTQPSGCGKGYLTDGGPDGANPLPGPALQMRPQYTGPLTVPAAQLRAELCPNPARPYQQPEDAAYCAPPETGGEHSHTTP